MRIMLGAMGLFTLAATTTAAARSAPPSVGRGVDFTEERCFHLFFSTVRNDCAEPHNFEIPLQLDSSGGKTVSVSVFATTQDQVCCEAVGNDEAVQFQFRSNRVCTNGSGVQTLTLTGAQIPSRGRMFAACTLRPGGTINTINWNQ